MRSVLTLLRGQKSISSTVDFILSHPLNRDRKVAAFLRFLSWQLRSRALPGPFNVKFAGRARLVARRGLATATGNVYCGLFEFEDMAFVVHALRPGDLFVDVGANIGAYTVLAAKVAGANAIAFEPDPTTYGHLRANIAANDLASTVEARREAVGAAAGELTFTAGLDAVNHVVAGHEHIADVQRVPVVTLDGVLANRLPTMMKIDVEGFETEVINGGRNTIANPALRAIVIELNGSGGRYAFDEDRIHDRLVAAGFQPASYEPFTRTLQGADSRRREANTLYVRDIAAAQALVTAAPPLHVLGRNL